MSYPQTELLTVTTDASGDGSATSSKLFIGPLRTIVYTPDGTSPFPTGFDVVVTSAATGQTLWDEDDVGTAAVTRSPRQPIHDVAGDPSLYAATGEPVEDYVFLANEQVKVTVAQGGNAKTGTFRIIGG